MTPEQELTELEADLARLAPDLRRMFGRAAAAFPGPRSAGGSSSGGWDIDTETDQAEPKAKRPEDPHKRLDRQLDAGEITYGEWVDAWHKLRLTEPTPVAPDDDASGGMNRDEARALNGPDVAERDVRAANDALMRMRGELTKLITFLAPYRERQQVGGNQVPAGWCPNCYRLNDHHHSPTKMKKRDGMEGPAWADRVCNYCGTFRAGNDFLPTRKILKVRFSDRGRGTVSPQLIESEERGLPRAVKAEIKRRRAEKAKGNPTEFTPLSA